MARVLVTGATGFIGAHLASRLLERGDEVSCLVRSAARLPARFVGRMRAMVGDVLDRESVTAAVADADVVIHLAGLVKAVNHEQFTAVNAGGTRHVAEACAARTSPPALVCVSSLAAAGPSADGTPLRERDPPKPVSHYGRSKLAGEEAVRAFAAHVPITVVRPPIVFGQGDPHTLAMFAPIARLGIHAVPGRSPQPISTIHVSDLCRLLIEAAERGRRLPVKADSDPGAGIYYATCTEHITYDELGGMIGTALGRRRVCILRNPCWAGWALAGLAEFVARMRRRAAILNRDKIREAFAGAWHCSGEQARRELGFLPNATLADRLSETVSWYRDQGWLPKPKG